MKDAYRVLPRVAAPVLFERLCCASDVANALYGEAIVKKVSVPAETAVLAPTLHAGCAALEVSK